MAKMLVTVNKLNKRKSIPTDFADKSSVIGVVYKGYEFEAEEVSSSENPTQDKWFKDREGYNYWGKGLAVQNSSIKTNPASGYPDWMLDLKIPEIWNKFNEFGQNAKIAVLDSGYNKNNTDINTAIKDEKTFINAPIDDLSGHGTHCASLIGGRNLNNITGCAPKSELYIAQIYSPGFANNGYTTIGEAINWAVQMDVDIISISYGGESSDKELEQTIFSAIKKNILVIASIGDTIVYSDNKPLYPAMFAECIAVGATDKNNQVSSITRMSNKTEIYAPGEDISGYALNPMPEKLSGTSQATAIVAGICALIISRYKFLKLSYTKESILNLISENSTLINDDIKTKLISPYQIISKINQVYV